MPKFDATNIARRFVLDAPIAEIKAFGNGLINNTFRIRCENGSLYTLQRINTCVFTDPVGLTENIVGVCTFMQKQIAAEGGDVSREAMHPVPTHDGLYYYQSEEEGFWRAYRYIDGARGYDSPDREGLLYEAAYAFGRFQRRLGAYPAETLHETIRNFHNTVSRYEAFLAACEKDAAERAASVTEEIELLVSHKDLACAIVSRLADGSLPTRVTHNDTKLNNVLIDDATGKGLCVIDLDTVMPGSLLYDFGDSVRFACNHGAEDERDTANVWLDLNRFEEYVSGFLAGVGDTITPLEKEMLPVGVLVLCYEQSLRFLTDYLNGDVYFKISAPDHNLVRARAQLHLFTDVLQKQDAMQTITKKY